ncbi:RiPP maturation radical SAM protein 1 [Nonomuraea phyllanthi]|uniref:RiPP maturation radical SAM C-methyltransferase n=1 Tax=Nonomuraea phyllanthi TaxID=2219224 RepID=UPI001292F1E2|nr:RiPP maturation radical SAM C-methyltransferase [Nonomuraea phyllanthi]QFY07785.1 RiPP maturation radical SAM protein 1 [Nonomuraea phyllanthi]
MEHSLPARRRLRVALVNMPWSWTYMPSIQCGLLQSVVRKSGHDCDVLYLNLDLAAWLGDETYQQIVQIDDQAGHFCQLGEWLFSYAAFGDIRPDHDYFAEYPEVPEGWSAMRSEGPDRLIAYRRDDLPAWLESVVRGVDWASYDAVGFSSTFLQNNASLALGRLLKTRFPDLPLIFGGANFDGGMGVAYAEKLWWLDYVVSGEGDIALPALLDQLADGTDDPIPGVHRRGSGRPDPGEAARTRDLDSLPVPDYGDYFAGLARYDRAQVLGGDDVRLHVEFSRGCWWGAKHHCTFCGLNKMGMAYRSKSGPRAVAELEHLLRTYPTASVDATDNILDMKYLHTFCSELAERRWDLDLFFEVKANLSREQLALMARAGIRRIQPGIESLSTHLLELMRKGSTKLINIRLLKWALHYGIAVQWHLLAGFPGESDADYAEQAEISPLLHHLQPPRTLHGIWLERFSPYFTDPASFSISGVRPQPSYGHVYPADLDHARIAYYFDGEVEGTASPEAHGLVSAAVAEWQRAWSRRDRPTLFYRRLPGRLSIIDTRSGRPRKAVLEGWRGDAYEACGDTIRSGKGVHQQLLDRGHDLSLETVTRFLDDCCRSGVMVSEEEKYLSLALPQNPR